MPPRKQTDVPVAPEPTGRPTWTREQLLAHRGFGPAIIGEAMYQAVQALVITTGNGEFGPALLGQLPDSYKDQRTLKKD